MRHKKSTRSTKQNGKLARTEKLYFRDFTSDISKNTLLNGKQVAKHSEFKNVKTGPKSLQTFKQLEKNKCRYVLIFAFIYVLPEQVEGSIRWHQIVFACPNIYPRGLTLFLSLSLFTFPCGCCRLSPCFVALSFILFSLLLLRSSVWQDPQTTGRNVSLAAAIGDMVCAPSLPFPTTGTPDEPTMFSIIDFGNQSVNLHTFYIGFENFYHLKYILLIFLLFPN